MAVFVSSTQSDRGAGWRYLFPTDENSADLFTKNLPGPLFEKHANVSIGNGSDDLRNSSDSQGESVGGQMYGTD
jgi:hypothetical protein